MATFSKKLVGSDGVEIDFGDLVEVKLPGIHKSYTMRDGTVYEIDVPERIVIAEVKLLLSKGMVLKIIEIVEVEDGYDDPLTKIGQIIPFRYTKWEWRRLRSFDMRQPTAPPVVTFEEREDVRTI